MRAAQAILKLVGGFTVCPAEYFETLSSFSRKVPVRLPIR
jgi:hypothetical protein